MAFLSPEALQALVSTALGDSLVSTGLLDRGALPLLVAVREGARGTPPPSRGEDIGGGDLATHRYTQVCRDHPHPRPLPSKGEGTKIGSERLPRELVRDVMTASGNFEGVGHRLTSEGVQGRPRLAHESVQFFRLAAVASWGGELPLLYRVAEGCSTRSDFQRLNEAFARYLRLPEGERRSIREPLLSRSEGVTVEAFEVAVDAVLQKGAQGDDVVGRSLLVHVPPQARRAVEGEAPSGFARGGGDVSPYDGEPGRSETALGGSTQVSPRIAFGSHPLHRLVSSLPPKEARELTALLTTLTSGRVVVSEVRPRIEVVVVRLLSMEKAASARAVDLLLRASVSERPGVRLLVVALLRQLAGERTAEEFQTRFLPYLQLLARDRRSVHVQAEAIRVLLDMGRNGKKGQEEMQALLEEIDLVPSLRRMLAGKDRTAILLGLALLSRAWGYLPSGVRERFAAMVMDLAENHPSEAVVVGAMDLLLTHYRDLDFGMRLRVLQNDLHSSMLAVTRMRYAGGWVHYAGQN